MFIGLVLCVAVLTGTATVNQREPICFRNVQIQKFYNNNLDLNHDSLTPKIHYKISTHKTPYDTTESV